MGEFTIGCEDKKQPTLQQQTPPSVWHFMLEVIVTLLKLQAHVLHAQFLCSWKTIKMSLYQLNEKGVLSLSIVAFWSVCSFFQF